jgi:transcriptional regulator with XRE-family HTH domain
MNSKLKAALNRSNMSQIDLARAMEVHPSLVTLWIQGKRVPSTSKLKKLGRLVGLKIEDLI